MVGGPMTNEMSLIKDSSRVEGSSDVLRQGWPCVASMGQVSYSSGTQRKHGVPDTRPRP